MTIDDLQTLAYQVAAFPTLRKRNVDPNEALFRYWRDHKEVGTPATGEYTLDDGSRALITNTGKILHWTGGDEVLVV